MTEETQGARDMVVTRPFTLTTQNGEKLTYGVGTHKDTPLDVADHWYAKAHSLAEGEEAPAPTSGEAASDKNRAALTAAQDEVLRLQTISQKATDDHAAAEVRATQLQERVDELEAECVGLRSQLEGGEVEQSDDEINVYRKGKKWFVDRSGDRVGEFTSKSDADARAAELRAGYGDGAEHADGAEHGDGAEHVE